MAEAEEPYKLLKKVIKGKKNAKSDSEEADKSTSEGTTEGESGTGTAADTE